MAVVSSLQWWAESKAGQPVGRPVAGLTCRRRGKRLAAGPYVEGEVVARVRRQRRLVVDDPLLALGPTPPAGLQVGTAAWREFRGLLCGESQIG